MNDEQFAKLIAEVGRIGDLVANDEQELDYLKEIAENTRDIKELLQCIVDSKR